MNEINTTSIINQMRIMASQAKGQGIESSGNATQFKEVFSKALDGVNDAANQADNLKLRYEMGDSNVSLADAMVASQKSNLAFEGALRVRNKLVDAYKEIMNMPV